MMTVFLIRKLGLISEKVYEQIYWKGRFPFKTKSTNETRVYFEYKSSYGKLNLKLLFVGVITVDIIKIVSFIQLISIFI